MKFSVPESKFFTLSIGRRSTKLNAFALFWFHCSRLP